MPERTCSVDGCTKAHRAKGFCSTHYNQLKPDRHQLREVPCTICGKPVTKNGGGVRRPVCSIECRWWTQFGGLRCPIPETHPAHSRWTGRLLPVLYVAVPVVPKPEPRIRWVAGKCDRCGKHYIAEDYTDTARYCSTTCARRINKHRYRARKRAAYVSHVSPRRIYERDGWTCQLCGLPVERGQVAPADLAPVPDHKVPLARGGKHEPSAIQCAHFLCNSIKGDRLDSEIDLAALTELVLIRYPTGVTPPPTP